MNNLQWLDEVKFNEQGLIPAIAQHHQTGRILMVAWMNREALALTAEKNQAVYFSRSRQKLWHKGEESGHFQTVHEIRLDCDADVIVLQIEQHGGIACHTGRESCFYRKLTANGWEIVDAQLKDPSQIYAEKSANPHTLAMNASTAQSEQIEILDYLGQMMAERKKANPEIAKRCCAPWTPSAATSTPCATRLMPAMAINYWACSPVRGWRVSISARSWHAGPTWKPL
jgi:phosphoribosyl-ATP pyrophosphohydrolase/phosphoribosyl-AMP cyclohydrolase